MNIPAVDEVTAEATKLLAAPGDVGETSIVSGETVAAALDPGSSGVSAAAALPKRAVQRIVVAGLGGRNTGGDHLGLYPPAQ